MTIDTPLLEGKNAPANDRPRRSAGEMYGEGECTGEADDRIWLDGVESYCRAAGRDGEQRPRGKDAQPGERRFRQSPGRHVESAAGASVACLLRRVGIHLRLYRPRRGSR